MAAHSGFRNRLTRIVALLFAFLAVAGTGVACGGDDESSSSTTAVQSSTTSAGSGGSSTTGTDDDSGSAMNDIQECEIADGTGTASGVIENMGAQAASYKLTLAFTDDATGEELGTKVTDVDSVEPGGSGDWSITVDGLADAEVTCATKSLEVMPAQ